MESENPDLPVSGEPNNNTEVETNENEDIEMPEGIPKSKTLDENLSSVKRFVESTRSSSLVSSTEEDDEDQEGTKVPKHPYGDNYDPITAKHIKQTVIKLGIIKLSWPPLDTVSFERLRSYPLPYRENSKKEKCLLLFTENFRQQYHHKFPNKKPLLLAALNEYDIQKMVSTTIRPTKLQYPEFYTWQGCANFVSDHITYKPLNNPLSLMKRCIKCSFDQ